MKATTGATIGPDSGIYRSYMAQIDRILLKDKEITSPDLVSLITACLIEMGGISDVGKNLAAMGYSTFGNAARGQLEESALTHVLSFKDVSANDFLVICIIIFVTVKENEADVLITTSFDDGIKLLRHI